MTTSTKTRPVLVDLSWLGDLRFEATNAKGLTAEFDGETQSSFSPMESVLAALCSCIGIDLALILKKMRLEVEGLSVSAEGERNSEDPKHYTRMELIFRVEGGLPREKVQKALDLSFDKYCSVFHSLRSDLVIDRRLEIV